MNGLRAAAKEKLPAGMFGGRRKTLAENDQIRYNEKLICGGVCGRGIF